jgi:hypothetical protein
MKGEVKKMGYMKEFAQEIAEVMGLPEIDNSVLELGQRILVARELPLRQRLSENMRIAKDIRAERFILICGWCLQKGIVNIKRDDYWENIKCVPQGKQLVGMCPCCIEDMRREMKQTA